MSWLDTVTPINLQEEKQKFFADQTYNPQFLYSEAIDEKSLAKFGFPEKKYLDLAKEILDKSYFGRNENDLLMTEGPRLSQEEVSEKFQTFLEMHNLEKRYEIIWSPSFVSRATITDDKLKLRTTAAFHKEGLIGVIYHELGTHALRRMNYEKQPWYKKKKEFGIKHSYLRTEEGLAALHSLIAHTYKSAYTSGIRYTAVEYARTHSFVEVWNFLGKYVQDPETRWMITLRQKRGLSDTSQPGGSTKDLVYFEGLVEVWKWLTTHNYNLHDLYFGKIAYQDLDIALQLNPQFEPVLPSFYTLNPEEYAQKIQEIGEYNMLNQ
jgi:hypothetical protein